MMISSVSNSNMDLKLSFKFYIDILLILPGLTSRVRLYSGKRCPAIISEEEEDVHEHIFGNKFFSNNYVELVIPPLRLLG